MSTVNGQIKLPNGSSYVGPVRFRPTFDAYADDNQIVFPADVVISTDEAGLFTTVLRTGNYGVYIEGQSRGIEIGVPDDDEIYAIEALLSRDIPTPPLNDPNYYTAIESDARFLRGDDFSAAVYNPDLDDYCLLRVRGLGTAESPYTIELLDPA